MVDPEPCKELNRRISSAIYGWDCPLLTFTYEYPGFDCDSRVFLGATSPFFSTILLFEHRIRFPPKKDWCWRLSRTISDPWKEWTREVRRFPKSESPKVPNCRRSTLPFASSPPAKKEMATMSRERGELPLESWSLTPTRQLTAKPLS